MEPTQTAPKRHRPRLALATMAVVAAAVLLTGCLSADQTTDVNLVNAARKDVRLAALNVDSAAASKAQGWSEHMAATGVLEHSGGGSKVSTTGLTNWCSLGENVGYGASIQRIHDAFMASAAHKAHILGKFDRIGTGVYKKGSTYWVTEIYLRTC